jgi:hypothetical protein
MEQLKIREALIEQQKQINRMTYEESMIDREKYLNEMKELSEKRKQNKWQIRKYLNDQINTRKKIMVSAIMVKDIQSNRDNSIFFLLL